MDKIQFLADDNCQSVIHFPDLAEIRSGNLTGTEDMDSIPTEFVFATTGTYAVDVTRLTKHGFKEVGAMKNWHWIHHNEWTNPIRLFWKRVKPIDSKHKLPTSRPSHFMISSENKTKYHNDERLFLQKNGCGMKVGDHVSRRSFYRYFALLRMPVKPSKHQLRWLKAANFRLIDTGSQASYWNNGWETKEDWSVDKEQAFWRKRGVCWKEDTDFTYHYRDKGGLYTPGLRVRMVKHVKSGGDPHNVYLDPTVCPNKYGETGTRYINGGQYILTPKKEFDLKEMSVNPTEYSQFTSVKHFYGVEGRCIKCNNLKTGTPEKKVEAVIVKPTTPPPVGLVKHAFNPIITRHRHLFRGGNKCILCKAPRPVPYVGRLYSRNPASPHWNKE